jgi:hypothetical protein
VISLAINVMKREGFKAVTVACGHSGELIFMAFYNEYWLDDDKDAAYELLDMINKSMAEDTQGRFDCCQVPYAMVV